MSKQSFSEAKLELIELMEFFYDNYQEQKLDWFDDVFDTFKKLRKKMGK